MTKTIPVGTRVIARLRALANEFDREAQESDGGAADAYGDAALRLDDLLDELEES